MSASALYIGSVVHQRLKPRRHRLRYRVFSLFVDIDDLTSLDTRLRLFGYNRWAMISFCDADHGDGSGQPLRAWIEAQLKSAGIDCEGGSIRILCYPRVFGYVFNPLSIYFCYRCNDSLAAMLYEVNNTFGQRHCYLIPVDDKTPPIGGIPFEQNCDKKFYVSPFIPMRGRYQFKIRMPAETVGLVINHYDDAGCLLHASFNGRRVPLDDRSIGRSLLTHPLMTAKVMAGIHWEALRLWLKGVPLVARPHPPADLVTVVGQPAAPKAS